MKQQRCEQVASAEDFRELDAMVLAEIESMGDGADKRRPAQKPGASKRRKSGSSVTALRQEDTPEKEGYEGEFFGEEMPVADDAYSAARRRPRRAPGRGATGQAVAPVAPVEPGDIPEEEVGQGEFYREQPLMEDEGGDRDLPECTLADLLSPEEQAFITRAVGFLSQRANADMIVNRIWEELTETDPEGFLQAGDEEPGASADFHPESDADEPGEGSTDEDSNRE